MSSTQRAPIELDEFRAWLQDEWLAELRDRLERLEIPPSRVDAPPDRLVEEFRDVYDEVMRRIYG